MSSPNVASDPVARTGFQRVAPAFALFFLSPFVAECLLGDFSINAIGAYLMVAPVYGGGAVLVREIARRLGRGWPAMLTLALAYALLEEGILIQTLFNPNYLGLHLLAQGWVPALGISLWWTPFVLTLHVVWSISTPIAIVEAITADRRETPWLGNLGLGVAAVLIVLGGVAMYGFTQKMGHFRASTPQLLTVAALIVALVLLGTLRSARTERASGAVPPALGVGAIAFVLGLAFMRVDRLLHDWPLVGAQWALVLAATALLLIWARRERWTALHTLAAAGGALLTYACTAFGQPPVVGGKGAIAWVSHVVFGAIAVTLLVLALRRQGRWERQAAASTCPVN